MVADNISAVECTINQYYGDEPQTHHGIQVIPFDAWRCSGWHLASHGGFFTYPHHDSSGFLTYVYARSGAKLWAVYFPDLILPEKMDGEDNAHYLKRVREAIYKKLDAVIQEGNNECEGLGMILLEPGDLL